jgi:hypothetical protein
MVAGMNFTLIKYHATLMHIRCGLVGIDTGPWTDTISYTTNFFLTYELFQVVIT